MAIPLSDKINSKTQLFLEYFFLRKKFKLEYIKTFRHWQRFSKTVTSNNSVDQ